MSWNNIANMNVNGTGNREHQETNAGQGAHLNGTGNREHQETNAGQGAHQERDRPVSSSNRQPLTLLRAIHGTDIVQAIANYATTHGCVVFVLSASGQVHRSPPHSGRETVTYPVASPILSLTGTVFPGQDPIANASLTVYVADPEGKVTGGIVVGPLVAMASVQIVTLSCMDNNVEHLPLPAYNDSVQGLGSRY